MHAVALLQTVRRPTICSESHRFQPASLHHVCGLVTDRGSFFAQAMVDTGRFASATGAAWDSCIHQVMLPLLHDDLIATTAMRTTRLRALDVLGRTVACRLEALVSLPGFALCWSQVLQAFEQVRPWPGTFRALHPWRAVCLHVSSSFRGLSTAVPCPSTVFSLPFSRQVAEGCRDAPADKRKVVASLRSVLEALQRLQAAAAAAPDSSAAAREREGGGDEELWLATWPAVERIDPRLAAELSGRALPEAAAERAEAASAAEVEAAAVAGAEAQLALSAVSGELAEHYRRCEAELPLASPAAVAALAAHLKAHARRLRRDGGGGGPGTSPGTSSRAVEEAELAGSGGGGEALPPEVVAVPAAQREEAATAAAAQAAMEPEQPLQLDEEAGEPLQLDEAAAAAAARKAVTVVQLVKAAGCGYGMAIGPDGTVAALNPAGQWVRPPWSSCCSCRPLWWWCWWLLLVSCRCRCGVHSVHPRAWGVAAGTGGGGGGGGGAANRQSGRGGGRISGRRPEGAGDVQVGGRCRGGGVRAAARVRRSAWGLGSCSPEYTRVVLFVV